MVKINSNTDNGIEKNGAHNQEDGVYIIIQLSHMMLIENIQDYLKSNCINFIVIYDRQLYNYLTLFRYAFITIYLHRMGNKSSNSKPPQYAPTPKFTPMHESQKISSNPSLQQVLELKLNQRAYKTQKFAIAKQYAESTAKQKSKFFSVDCSKDTIKIRFTQLIPLELVEQIGKNLMSQKQFRKAKITISSPQKESICSLCGKNHIKCLGGVIVELIIVGAIVISAIAILQLKYKILARIIAWLKAKLINQNEPNENEPNENEPNENDREKLNSLKILADEGINQLLQLKKKIDIMLEA